MWHLNKRDQFYPATKINICKLLSFLSLPFVMLQVSLFSYNMLFYLVKGCSCPPGWAYCSSKQCSPEGKLDVLDGVINDHLVFFLQINICELMVVKPLFATFGSLVSVDQMFVSPGRCDNKFWWCLGRMWRNSTISVHGANCFPLPHKSKVNALSFPDKYYRSPHSLEAF